MLHQAGFAPIIMMAMISIYTGKVIFCKKKCFVVFSVLLISVVTSPVVYCSRNLGYSNTMVVKELNSGSLEIAIMN